MTRRHPILDPRVGGSQRARFALGVMTKAPLSGAVKTRLAPPLKPEEAAELSRCFLRDIAENIAAAGAMRSADGVAVYFPPGAEEAYDGLLPDGFSLLQQRGESLGDRLANGSQDLFDIGYSGVCLINGDSPTLPQEFIIEALTALSRPGDRVVLGGADDGGYYLVGLKKAHRRLFQDIEWSTTKVLAQTVHRAAEINLEVELLPLWYDVDDASTLKRLCDELFSPNGLKMRDMKRHGYPAPHTRAHLLQLSRRNDHKDLFAGLPS